MDNEEKRDTENEETNTESEPKKMNMGFIYMLALFWLIFLGGAIYSSSQ